MERLYDMAGTIVRVTGAEEDLSLDTGVLAPFEVQNVPYDRTLHIGRADTLPPPEGECVFNEPSRRVYRSGAAYVTYIGSVAESVDSAYIRVVRTGKHSTAQVKRSAVQNRIRSKTVLAAMEAEHFIVADGGFLFHASCIEWEGTAILFTAPSGTGKSTQAALWEQYRGAEVINGDRIAVCVGENGVEARGVPFAGSSGISKNKKLPLRAIVYLAQAGETTVTRMSGYRAFRRLWEGCGVQMWNREDVARCAETVQQVLTRVPVYYMPCTPDEAAVAALEDVLRKG